MCKAYTKFSYYSVAVDPIHVGSGGYRIGRVDNTIVREKGTNLPKIPGTSLAGVARAYAAMSEQVKKNNGKYLGTDGKSCAGKGGASGEDHCGQADCPICMSFGYSKDKNSFQGLAQISDALIYLLPVHTFIGTIWMTSPGALHSCGVSFAKPADYDPDKVYVHSSLLGNLPDSNRVKKLNLGFMLFDAAAFDTSDIIGDLTRNVPLNGWIKLIGNNIAIIGDKHFSQLVNASLEVRTSVSIKPETGAAEGGALFTYEAIPRGTIFKFDVIVANPAFFKAPATGSAPGITPENVHQTIDNGLGYMAMLGIGGMNTRGMGRMAIVVKKEE